MGWPASRLGLASSGVQLVQPIGWVVLASRAQRSWPWGLAMLPSRPCWASRESSLGDSVSPDLVGLHLMSLSESCVRLCAFPY